MKALLFVLCLLFAYGELAAQTNVWEPSAGHAQVRIWPGAAPDAHPLPGPEYVTTVTNLVAGKPWAAVDNVSQSTLTVYSPTEKNTGVAVVVFPGGGYNCLAIDLEAYQRHCRRAGGVPIAPPNADEAFVTIWPVISLDWRDIVGDPLHVGPIPARQRAGWLASLVWRQ